jgi:hypothetical protein
MDPIAVFYGLFDWYFKVLVHAAWWLLFVGGFFNVGFVCLSLMNLWNKRSLESFTWVLYNVSIQILCVFFVLYIGRYIRLINLAETRLEQVTKSIAFLFENNPNK